MATDSYARHIATAALGKGGSGGSGGDLSNYYTKQQINGLIQDFINNATYDKDTGKLTFNKRDGSTIELDIQSGLSIVGGTYDATTEKIILTLSDDSTVDIDVSGLINKYYADDETVELNEVDGKLTFSVKDGVFADAKIVAGIEHDIDNLTQLFTELQDTTTKGIYVGYINSVTPTRSAMEEIIKNAIKANASMIILRPALGLPQDFVAISSGRNLQNYKNGGKGYMFFTDINEHSDSSEMPSVMSYTTKVNFTVTATQIDDETEISVTIDNVETDFVSGINSTAQHAYVLHTKNETEYVPTKPYHPATKDYVDSVATGGGTPYTLPIASETELGGIKVGDNLEIDSDGVLKAKSEIDDTQSSTNTTYSSDKIDEMFGNFEGIGKVLAYESDKEYKQDELVYRKQYVARVLQDFTSSTIDTELSECWDDDIKLGNILVINTDHMHLMMEYGQGNFYETDILVYLNELICRVVNDFTADDTLGNSVEDSFNEDIGAGHLVLLNKEADHNILEYKRGTFYEKNKLVWGDGRICRVLNDYTSDTTAGYTLGQSIKKDMERGHLEELGEKYKFKLYKTTMDLNKVIDSINIIPVSTIVFEDVDDIDIMRISEGIYGPLGTLALITKIDKNNQIIEAKTVNSREMEFMPPAPNTIRYTVVTSGSGYAVGDIVKTTNDPTIFGEVEEVDAGGGLVKVKQSDAIARNTNGSGGDVTAERIFYMGNGKKWYEHNIKGVNAVLVEYEQGKTYEENNLIYYETVLTRAAHDFTADATQSTTLESFKLDITNGHLIRLTNEEVSVPECLGSVKTDQPTDLPVLAIKGNWVLIEDCEINSPGQAGIGLYNGTSWDILPIPKGDFTFPEPNADGRLYFRKVDTGDTVGQWEAFTKVDGNEIEVTIREDSDNNFVPKKGELVWDSTRGILVIGDGTTKLGELDEFYGQTVTSADILAAIGYTPEDKAEKGQANGYAPLGADSKVPAGFLPDSLTDTYSKSEIDAKDLDVQNTVTALVNTEASRAKSAEADLQNDLNDHVTNDTIHVTQNEKDGWDAKVDTTDLDPFNNHITDNDIHVTQTDKDRWDGMNKAYYVTDKSLLPTTGNAVGNIGYVQVSAPGVTPVVCDQYIWDGNDWKQLDSSQVSLQFTWGNIQGKPGSTALAIDNAVTVAHTHNNKFVLDKISQSPSGNFMYDGVEIGVKVIFVENDLMLPTVGTESTLYVVFEDSRTRNYPSISIYRDNAYQILGRGAQEAAPTVGDMNILQAEYYSVVAGSTFKINVTPNQYFCFMPLEILKEIPGLMGQTRIITDFTDWTKFKYNENLISINPASRLTINIREIDAELKTVSDKYYYTASVDLDEYKDIDNIG